MIELKRDRTIKTFDQVLATYKPATRRGFEKMFSNFGKFCNENYEGNMEEMVRKLLKENESTVGGTIQEWIVYNSSRSPTTIRGWMSYLKTYLVHRGVNFPKTRIKLPRVVKEEKYGLSLEDIQKILNVAGVDMRLKMLVQLTSGMRRGEMLRLKKKDFHIRERVMIKIPALIAKFDKGRTTFISSEASQLLIPRLRTLKDSDLVFSSIDIKEENIGDSYEQNIVRYLQKTGLDMRYESTGYHQINTHSFRAYFITKISRHDPNLAKKWAGQEIYMGQYDRLSDQEMLEKYIEFEPDLFIFKQKPKSQEILELAKKVEEKDAKLEELAKQIEEIKNQRFETQKTLTHSVIEGIVASLDEWGRAGGKIPKGKEKAWKRKLELENRLFREIALLKKSTGKKFKVNLKDYE